jgi:hypothetical protein
MSLEINRKFSIQSDVDIDEQVDTLVEIPENQNLLKAVLNNDVKTVTSELESRQAT